MRGRQLLLFGLCVSLVQLGWPTESDVDPEIVGPERQTMEALLATLPAEFGTNIVYLSPERIIYSNRIWLKGKFAIATMNSDGTYTDSIGSAIPLPPYEGEVVDQTAELRIPSLSDLLNCQPCAPGKPSAVFTEPQGIPPLRGGFGPYRRVSSLGGNSGILGLLSIDNLSYFTAADVQGTHGERDTPYLYIGGRDTGLGIDAGLQGSPAFHNWSPFMRFATNGAPPTVWYSMPNTIRLISGKGQQPNQGYAFLGFYKRTNLVALTIYGTWNTAASPGLFEYQVTLIAFLQGMSAYGPTFSFKRVTSIAQVGANGGPREGTSHRTWLRNAHWKEWYIGPSDADNQNLWLPHTWGASDTLAKQCYPSLDAEIVNWDFYPFTFNYVSNAEETVSIDLRAAP